MSRDVGLARFSGTTRVPQSAGYGPPSVVYRHGASRSVPAFAPAGTETAGRVSRTPRNARPAVTTVMSESATTRAGVKVRGMGSSFEIGSGDAADARDRRARGASSRGPAGPRTGRR